MARRQWPRAALSSTTMSEASGPRWAMASSMVRSWARAPEPGREKPAMPHIYHRLTATRRGGVAACWTMDLILNGALPWASK